MFCIRDNRILLSKEFIWKTIKFWNTSCLNVWRFKGDCYADSKLILLKDKIILIEVLDTYDSPKDITWVKQKNAEWIDLLFSKNQ